MCAPLHLALFPNSFAEQLMSIEILLGLPQELEFIANR